MSRATRELDQRASKPSQSPTRPVGASFCFSLYLKLKRSRASSSKYRASPSPNLEGVACPHLFLQEWQTRPWRSTVRYQLTTIAKRIVILLLVSYLPAIMDDERFSDLKCLLFVKRLP